MKKHLPLILMLLFVGVSITFALSGNDSAYIKKQEEIKEQSIETVFQAKESWLSKAGELDQMKVGIDEEIIQKVEDLNINEDIFGRIKRIIKVRKEIKTIEKEAQEEREIIKESCQNIGKPLNECLEDYYSKIFPKTVTKKGWSKEASYWHQYIYEKSGYKKECVIIKEAENGNGDWLRRHNPSNNSAGVDWGLCGINDHYHPDIVNDPRFFTDQQWQADQCVRMCLEFLETGNPKFYGYIDITRRNAAINNLIFTN